MKKGQMADTKEQMKMQQQQEKREQRSEPETGQPIEGGGQIDPETGMPMEEGGEQMDPAMMGGEEEMGEEGGTELDQHIGELESLVAKGEKPKVTDLRKAIKALSNLRKSKNQLKSNHKKVTVSKQKDLVDNMLKKWEKESSKTVMNDLEEIIEKEGIKLD